MRYLVKSICLSVFLITFSNADAWALGPRCLKSVVRVTQSTVERSTQLTEHEKLVIAKVIEARKNPRALSQEELEALAKFGLIYAVTPSDRVYFNKVLNKLRVRDQFDTALAEKKLPLESSDALSRLAIRDRGFADADLQRPGFIARNRWALVSFAFAATSAILVSRPDYAQRSHDWISAKSAAVGANPYVQDAWHWTEAKLHLGAKKVEEKSVDAIEKAQDKTNEAVDKTQSKIQEDANKR